MRQISFDPLRYSSAKEARAERDAEWRRLKNLGKQVNRFTLKNQLRKWEALGVPDGRVRDVYYINVIGEI